MINPQICVWCLNREREICIRQCSPEGKFRFFEPAALAPWEPPPSLPPFRDLVATNGHVKLALLYLAIYHLQLLQIEDR